MDLDDAIYNMVHDYPGGVPALATRLTSIDATTGKPKPMNANTLQQKASANNPVAHFSPKELLKAMDKTGDLGPLVAMAAALGQMLLPMPGAQGMEGDLALKLASACKEFGELLTEISGDLVDGTVTQNEQRRIERSAGELIASIHALLGYTAGLAESAKPAHLKVAR
jgi:hypothetical protein